MKLKRTNVNLFAKKSLIIVTMRAFIFLYCTAVFSFNTEYVLSQNANIKIDADKTISVDEVFDLIMEQTDYRFVYQEGLFKDLPNVKLTKGYITVNTLLKQSLTSDNFKFELNNSNTLVVSKKTALEKEQEIEISGVVTDQKGESLPGMTVYVTDQKPGGKVNNQFLIRGTSTDIDGKFTLKAEVGHYLVVGGIGFEVSYQQVIANKTVYNVTLKEASTKLEELVFVGYGTQKRGEVSSSISSVAGEKVVNNLGANTSFDRGLSGTVKGVQVTQSSGQPGSGVDINIRGITSPFADGNNNPLFVIDGVPFQASPAFTFNADLGFNTVPNPLQAINPNEIESIDVLKDASATAIYGSRGANGVIIVNTKRGKKNEKTNISFSSTFTIARPINTPKMLNTQQYKDRAAQLLKNSAAFANTSSALNVFTVNGYKYMADVPVDFTKRPYKISYKGLKESWFGKENTNWVDLVYRDPASTQQYNLAVNGGTDKTSYSMSLGHTNQEGLVQEEKFKQYNFRASVETQVNKIVSSGFNVNLGYSDNQTGYSGGTGYFNRMFSARPDFAPYDTLGKFNRLPGKVYGVYDVKSANPLALATGHNNNTKSVNFLGNVFFEIEPIKNLKIRSDVNVGRFSTDVNNFRPVTKVGTIIPARKVFATSAESSLTTNRTTNTNLITNLRADYSMVLAEKHTVRALLGFAWDRNYADRSNYYFTGFPDDNTLTTASSALQTGEKARNEIETGLNSIFSRISYNYAQKYFVTLNFRTDKSIKFGPQNRSAYFPSISGSWNITNESFMDNVDMVNNLSLRVGYGRTGQNNVGDFAYLQFWAVGQRANGLYNGNMAVGLNGNLPNVAVKWENTDEVNLGLDFALFNYRLSGSIDVYNRKTTGALMNGLFLLESGANRFIENFADLTNKGVEIALDGDIIRNEDLTWSLGVNLAKNINTLDKFNGSGVNPYLARFYELGREVNIIRGYVTDGYFQTQKEIDDLNAKAKGGVYQEKGTAPGDYKYVDLNGDGKITTEDQQYLGSAQPDLFGGFSSTVSYKGISLSANFVYSLGGEATITSDLTAIAGDPTSNIETRYLDTWTPTNPNAAFPRAILNDTGLNRNSRTSSALVYNTSHLRLQSLRLSYNLPNSIIERIGLSRAALSFIGTNLFTVTDFPGLDPTAIGGFSSIGSNSNSNPYPLSKTWSVGINVNF